MAVTLLRVYKGAIAGTVLSFPTAEETSLVAQNFATVAAVANTTTGPQTSNALTGIAAIPVASSSVVITNALVDANSIVFAAVRQAAADTTLLRVERIVPAAGSFTIFGTAGATATTLVEWSVLVPGGFGAPTFAV